VDGKRSNEAPQARALIASLTGLEGARAERSDKKWFASAAPGFVPSTLPCVAQTPWTLVTPAENARDRVAPQMPAPADTPAPPRIDVLRSVIARRPQNLVATEVRFSAGRGKAIIMRSFRADDGWLGINITNQVLEQAVQGSDCLSPENANLPAGDRRITLSIVDNSGRTAARTFPF